MSVDTRFGAKELNKKFHAYNFISCIRNNKEYIFAEDGKRLIGAKYYLGDCPVELQIYTVLNELFKFSDDTMVVFLMGYKYEYGWEEIVKFIKSHSPKKLVIFNDDAHTPWNSNKLHTVIDPLKNKTHEGLVISYLVAECGIKDYQVYDCEYGALQFYHDNISADRYHYYDTFTQTWPTVAYEDLREYSPAEDFKYKVCCTNKKPDIHRALACIHLIDAEDVKLTYYDKPRWQVLMKMISYTNTCKAFPPEPTYRLLSKDYAQTLESKHRKFIETDLTWDSTDHNAILGSSQVKTIEIARDSFLTLVAETLWDTPTRFWSEKTLKPAMMMRPFVILAPPNTLNMLRRLGFQTFSSFWDESYDEEPDHGKRFEMAMNIVDSIVAKSFDELREMLEEMRDVLEHNKAHAKKIHLRKICNC